MNESVTTVVPRSISRQMKVSEVISHLIQHGIPDLTGELDTTTFGEHPIDTNGAFSDVYCGHMRGNDRELVATKVLRVTAQSFSDTSPEHLRNAARELHTWSKCRHRNVLPLRGLADFRGRIGMVSPWMNRGPLPGYLRNYPAAENPQVNRIEICRQICEGLSYLHDKGIIHGDLKGANVLVSEDGTPVLADFGNSTLKDRSLKFTQATDGHELTGRWSAPERVISRPALSPTKAADVYSLGMTIYEVITGKHPYHDLTEIGVLLMLALPTNWVPPGKLESKPADHTSRATLENLLHNCWSYQPAERPSAGEVAITINRIPPLEVVFSFGPVSQHE